MHTPSSARHGSQWDPPYEKKAVGLLALGFGLVGLDRFIINPLFPVMAKDLGLNYQDMGLISAVLALAWGLSSIFTGRLSDQIGRKKVLIPAVVIFSLLVATSGLASGLLSLLLIRGLMGLAEGAYVPASIVSTIEASKPSRIGLNIGIQQMAAPLVGLGFGPVVAVFLLKVLPSWHWVFGVVAIPGLIVAWLMARTLRESVIDREASTEFKSSWWEVLRYRNVVFGTLGMCTFLSCLIVLSAFMPNYLTDHLKLSLDQMGLVLAGLGVGSFIGMVLVPALSDRFGRKIVMIISLVIELAALSVLPSIGAEPVQLFGVLFVATFMNAGVVAITVGPLTHGSVPARLATTATGIVVGIGELIGGAVAPAIAGGLAQNSGITVIPQIALVSIIAGLAIVVLGIREPDALRTQAA
jgi:MFS family permease